MVAAYVLDPARRRFGLDELARVLPRHGDDPLRGSLRIR